MVPPITLQLVAPFVLVILMYYQPYYYAQNAMGNPQFQDSFFIDVIKYGIKL